MASLGRLLVSLNLETRPFERAIKQAERSVKRTARSMESAGRSLTTGLTLPLAAAGGAALKAFGEFDSLKRGLATLEESSESLTGRLKELKEVAQLPGLGLKEAIQADIRLRSVGISADLAKRSMLQFGNAIALAGGGRSELDRVTTQLGQLSAKGKVLAQDLRPIIEAAPSVASALRELYGTVSSEDISKILEEQGKSSTDFIESLVEELAKAPRVTGGFKNAIENVGDALFVFGASIGEQINRTFNLTEAAERFSDTLTGLADKFARLNPGTQKFLIITGALAAGLGPLLLLASKLFSVFGSGFITLVKITRAVNNFNKAVAVGSLVDFRTKIVNGIKALTSFGRAAIVAQAKLLAIPAAIASIGLAVTYVVRNWEGLKERFQDIQWWKNALIDMVQFLVRYSPFSLLIDGINAVLRKFDQAEIPNPFANFSANLEIFKGTTKQYQNELESFDSFIGSVGSSIKDKFSKIFLDPLSGESGSNDGLIFGGASKSIENGGKNLVKQVEKTLSGLNQKLRNKVKLFVPVRLGGDLDFSDLVSTAQKELKNVGKFDFSFVGTGTAQSFGLLSGYIGDIQRKLLDTRKIEPLEGLKKSAIGVIEVSNSAVDNIVKSVNDSFDAIDQSAAAFGSSTAEILQSRIGVIRNAMQDLIELNQMGSEEFEKFQEQYNKLQLQFEGNKAITEALGALQEGFQQFAQSGLSNFNSLADGVKGAIQSVVGYLAKLIVAKAFGDAALSSPFGFLLAGGLAALASLGFNKALDKVSPPKLAEGGIVPNDPRYKNDRYPALLSAGEIVVPPKKLDKLMFNNQPKMGSLQVYGALQGETIHLSNKRQELKYQRSQL